MRSHNDSIDTTHTPPPLSFYNTFKTLYNANICLCIKHLKGIDRPLYADFCADLVMMSL